ncbi:nuclear transport factor 2 family protein [Maribacter sp. MMG018]|uniref:nuclear transport factor 2 family protein n=1 Tax=Maribacter sp. MMG018 TaxID=2822688 RepID=UPI001B37791F|nr:nuclear transport factor 2 family protein [Maribacter sp. MMG018]MBQ4914202.1 nuclear transport factor 2 family protein [Maribacter sp. MMG018]
MTTRFFKSLFSIATLVFVSCATTGFQSLKNEDIVTSYIKARNTYDLKKVDALTDKDYFEMFIDGNKEIENKEKLMDAILWGKELDSHIKLLDITSDGTTVTTIEENSNYLDVALKRKVRAFKIVYTFRDNKIHHQKMDTIPGYAKIIRHNSESYAKFMDYCNHNNLKCNGSFDQESGNRLRKILKKYHKENK